ncbi:hypothetical protein RchiOBHm_Chr6g0284021 [Rosa chinensis]|uniref:Zinc beta-ribbon domain-containing protein n=1 Tax=Rosa chinensis TaxID=74649 RepID=A0A2P6PU68_ROSCH|nr:uncharacterized protein LOC112168803 isoform X2 [Rosa chinensis]PRQ25470.1 hypothetical protein RchiOBHm_Chr6g0284021 [Rosa chinensis]
MCHVHNNDERVSSLLMDLESTMVSLRRQKRLRPCSGSSSGVASLPGFCDNGTSLQASTQEKPDNVHLTPSNNSCGSCLHIAMWLRVTGDASKERDEAIARVAELEKRVGNFVETTTKQEAVIEFMRQQVLEYSSMKREYESKLDGLLNDVSQQRQKAEMWESKCKEQEALHQVKATRLEEFSCHLEEVLKQLGEANADLSEVTQGLHVAREGIEKITGTFTQAEVKVKQLQKSCEMYRVLRDMEKEKHTKVRTAPSAELKEDLQRNENHKQNKDGNMLTREMIKELKKQVMRWSQEKFQEEGEDRDMDGEGSNASREQVEGGDALSFWTICNHCKMYVEYHRIYQSNFLLCQNCHNAFNALEVAPPPQVSRSSSRSSLQQH